MLGMRHVTSFVLPKTFVSSLVADPGGFRDAVDSLAIDDLNDTRRAGERDQVVVSSSGTGRLEERDHSGEIGPRRVCRSELGELSLSAVRGIRKRDADVAGENARLDRPPSHREW